MGIWSPCGELDFMTLKDLDRGEPAHALCGGRSFAVAEIANDDLAIVASRLADEFGRGAGVKSVRVLNDDRCRDECAIPWNRLEGWS